MKIIAVLFVVVALSVYSAERDAGAEQSLDVKGYVSKSINGSKNPAAVGKWRSLASFLNNYGGELDGELAQVDKYRVYDAIRENAFLRGEHGATSILRLHSAACQGLNDGWTEPKLLEAIERVESMQKSERRAVYEAFLDKLTRHGKATIEQYLMDVQAKKMSVVEFDYKALVERTPGRLRTNLTNFCEQDLMHEAPAPKSNKLGQALFTRDPRNKLGQALFKGLGSGPS